MSKCLRFTICAWLVAASAAFSAPQISQAQKAKIDEAVAAVLASSGAPSASIAVVWEGAIAYERAYGSAKVAPAVPATTAMRYAIGSVSKQFTATAILLLAEDGRLSLDDKVSRWLPDLTRAGDISVRQLLSMTAGYQDYWPQDYVFHAMLSPTTTQEVLDQWARKPLDFEPGTKWQYSNTNYMMAGLIVEKASGMPLFQFMEKRIFAPLGMASVRDIDTAPLGDEDATAYLRNALGPLRMAPKEGRGWLFAAAQLAMTAHDLAVWDVGMIKQSVLRPASYSVMQSDARTTSGVAVRYGLGLTVAMSGGRRQLSHGGAVSGFLSTNVIYPDDRAAIVVFCNVYPGAASPEGEVASRIARVLFEQADAEAARALDLAKRVFADVQQGRIDRSLFSANANAYFTPQVLGDFAASLGPLGTPTEFAQTESNLRGGMTFRAYRVACGGRTVQLTVRILPNGALEQFLIERAD